MFLRNIGLSLKYFIHSSMALLLFLGPGSFLQFLNHIHSR
jgi:hypothetical protein